MFKFVGLLIGLTVCNYSSAQRNNNWAASQYHNQDSFGSYRYGFTSPHHSKTETRSNGITQGGYSFVDANGILQTVSYTADDVNGFRIRASNLPQQIDDNNLPVGETPEVAELRKKHLAEHKRIENTLVGVDKLNRQTYNNNNNNENNNNELFKNPYLLTQAEASSINVPRPSQYPGFIDEGKKLIKPTWQYNYYDGDNYAGVPSSSSSLYPSSSSSSLSSSSSSLPSLQLGQSTLKGSSYILPIAPSYRATHSALHHTQDSLGQYDYSYTGDTSAKSESRSLDGTTRGAYSYIDANGILQQVHYIADHNGFRVLATNLPEAR